MIDNDAENDIYQYQDTLQAKRKDIKERIAQINATKNFHNLLCDSEISQTDLIERNYSKLLTTEESSECLKFLTSNQIDDTHYSFQDEFDRKVIYPLVGW